MSETWRKTFRLGHKIISLRVRLIFFGIGGMLNGVHCTTLYKLGTDSAEFQDDFKAKFVLFGPRLELRRYMMLNSCVQVNKSDRKDLALD